MRRWGQTPIWCCLSILSILPVGCGSLGHVETLPPPMASSSEPPIRQTGLEAMSSPEACPHPLPADSIPFVGLSELSIDDLVQQVLARNPSVAQMVAAWQAASARYPQVRSLDDPRFAVTIGPESFGSSTVNPAYRLELAQKFPFPGKLRLRGETAVAEAVAAGNQVEDIRLQLVEAAKSGFYDYYLVDRALEVNDLSLKLLRKFRENARIRYENNKVDLQDVLQADVEIGRQRERLLTLEQMREVAIARINTLLNLPPDAALPAPPLRVDLAEALPDVQVLRAVARSRRPDLQALANRIAAEEAALALAIKEFWPDFEPFVMYDRFMGNNAESEDLALMTGVRLNLPVQIPRRKAAIAEAQARIAQRRAELEMQTNQVNFDVQQAHAQVRESERAVRLYRETVLPAAEKNVEAAEIAYEAGKIPFLSLIEAERNLVGLRDRYYELLADYHRRRAALERAVGGPLTPSSPAR